MGDEDLGRKVFLVVISIFFGYWFMYLLGMPFTLYNYPSASVICEMCLLSYPIRGIGVFFGLLFTILVSILGMSFVLLIIFMPVVLLITIWDAYARRFCIGEDDPDIW